MSFCSRTSCFLLDASLVYMSWSTGAAGDVVAGFYFHWWVVVDVQVRFNACKGTLLKHLFSDESHGVGGYLFHPPIYNVVGLVVSWCLASFVIGDGDSCGELVKLDLGGLVPVSIDIIESSMSLVKLVPWGVWENFSRWNLR